MLKQPTVKNNIPWGYREIALKANMRSLTRKAYQIFGSIIAVFPIDMMNKFTRAQESPDLSFDDKAMLEHATTCIGKRVSVRQHFDVSRVKDTASAFPVIAFRPDLSNPYFGPCLRRDFATDASQSQFFPCFKGKLTPEGGLPHFLSSLRGMLASKPNLSPLLLHFRRILTPKGGLGHFPFCFFRRSVTNWEHYISPIIQSIPQYSMYVNQTKQTNGRKPFGINFLGG